MSPPRRLLLPLAWLIAPATAPAALAGTPAGARLVVTPAALAVLGPHAVQIRNADGRPLTRLPPVRGASAEDAAAASADDRARVLGERRERIWDLLGVPESSRDSDAAADLADDELGPSDRRVQPGDPGAGRVASEAGPALAAAGADVLWVIADGSLYRAGPTGRPGAVPEVARVAPAPAGATALAVAADGTLLLARGADLLATRDGRRWNTRAAAAAPITALVASARPGFVAWLAAGELTVWGPRPARYLPPAPIRTLAACGDDLVVLADDGVHVGARGGPPVRVSGPVPAHTLACAAGGGPWLAVGPGLLSSADGGRTWRPRPDAPAAALQAAAVAPPDRLWLLTAAGDLVALPLVEGARPPVVSQIAPSEAGLILRPRRGWRALLPRLAVQASHVDRGARRETRALLLADFALPRSPPPALGAGLRLAVLQTAPELPPPAAAGPAGELPRWTDPAAVAELACLPVVRGRAVTLALADPASARSLVTRAGRSAWLPELRVRVERRLGRVESLDVKPAASADALGLDTVDDVRWEVRATWDLPRLVFNPEEVAAQHQALRMADMRREIESQVNRLYFERRRLTMQPAGGPAEDSERILRMDELAAELDAVSGGAFSRCLKPRP